MRRTKVSLIYRRTRNLRAVQLLLGHTKLESTVRYLGHRSRRRSGNRRADRGLITRVAGRRVRRRPAASGRKRPAPHLERYPFQSIRPPFRVALPHLHAPPVGVALTSV